MKLAVCLFVAVLGMALASPAPPRPQLPTVYFAKIYVAIKDDTSFWTGGGHEAYDSANGRARIDIRLEGNRGPLFFDKLDRYDLNTTYLIEDRNCSSQAVTGSLPDPWFWVPQAQFSGSTTYHGAKLNEWTYVSGQTTLQVTVLDSNPNEPVFFSEKFVNGSYIYQWSQTFVEFQPITPEEWVWYVPNFCEKDVDLENLQGSPSGVVYFANSQWDCTSPSCSSRVPAGTGQPGYECAEFVARSLAYGGYIPGLSSGSAQSAYGNYRGHNLLLTTGLSSALASLGFRKLANSGSSVNAAVAIFGDAGDGYFSHTCIGIGANTVDCHNNARKGYTASGIMFRGIDAVYGP